MHQQVHVSHLLLSFSLTNTHIHTYTHTQTYTHKVTSTYTITHIRTYTQKERDKTVSSLFYQQLLRQQVYSDLSDARRKAYNIKVEHKFQLSGLTKLGVVLLVKLISDKEWLFAHLCFAPFGLINTNSLAPVKYKPKT